jgi:hypothetical protein
MAPLDPEGRRRRRKGEGEGTRRGDRGGGGTAAHRTEDEEG